jgi:ADP-heptose:LPS heptosyltransferase
VATVLEDLPRGSRVAILRLRSLGDCVLTTPALHLLKRARPDLEIAVMVEDRFRAVFEDNPDLAAILPPALRPLHSWRPSLCLNLHGGTRSAWLTALCGARWRAGYGHFRHAFVYNAHIPRAQQILGVARTVHTAEHAASAVFWLGVPLAWRPDGFLAVAAHLKHAGLDPIFIGAGGDDLSAFAAFRTLRGAPLSEIKDLLSGAALFVGNDSGPAHMAAAFGVPVVVLFGESNPAIWGPWRTASEIVPMAAEPAQVLQAVARLGVHA